MTSLDQSYDYCESLTRREAKNFFYSFRFLPPSRRRSIYAIYTFSRRCDDAVDGIEEQSLSETEARRRLAHLQDMLGDRPPNDPLVPALVHTLNRFAIPREPLDELVAGMEMDLTKKRYETFTELYEYCYRAAAVVGLVCIHIFGYREVQAREFAVQLGIAMQLTNILRDVREDERRDRIYLPAEDLDLFRYGVEDLRKGVVDDRFRGLMQFEVERAKEYFAASTPLYPLIEAESRHCPLLLAKFYQRILRIIERRDYDVLTRRPSLGRCEKLYLATQLWLKARLALAGG